MLLLPHFKGRSLISPDITLPLMKLARPAFMISMAAVVLSLALFAIRGLNYGVDFKGGTMLEVQSKGENSKADITFIRNKVSSLGLGDVQLGWLAVPVTVFCVVGVINAFNMIDGLDGLSGTIALISLIATAYLAALAGHSTSSLAISIAVHP